MTSQELEVRSAGALAVPRGARTLGSRTKPIIRLGMGTKDPERGFPRKTDYFTVRGDERAVGKFKQVYGEQPKSIKIMVPSELSLALDISYRSFVGGQSEDGGRPLALGNTNFAPLGYVGGPDVLKVWKQDGSFAEVETLGLDELGKPLDDIAADLKIEVHATFTFTIPEVLGWGSFAAVTSKGKKSADNLAFKLNEIYSAFGSKAPLAFSREEPPLLVLKPDSALTRFEDDKTGEAKWGKSRIYVLDIVIPESFDDMRDRIAEHQRELRGDSPHAAAALYSDTTASAAALPVAPDNGTPEPDEAGSEALKGEVVDEPETAFEGPEPGTEPEPPAEGSQFKPPAEADERQQEALRAAAMSFTTGKHSGKTIAEIHDSEDGDTYLRWAAKNWKTEPLRSALKTYVDVYLGGAS